LAPPLLDAGLYLTVTIATPESGQKEGGVFNSKLGRGLPLPRGSFGMKLLAILFVV
jgi:hypothetical protein